MSVKSGRLSVFVQWGARLRDHIVRTRVDRARRWPLLAISVAVVAGLTWVAGSSVPASANSTSELLTAFEFFDGSHYELRSSPLNWEDANTAANAATLGECASAHLATVTSALEQQVVTGLMASSDGNAWLGGFQPPDELTLDQGWQWVTGEPFAYTNWAATEPNDNPFGSYVAGSEQHLVALFGSGEWNDAPGIEEKYYIVEYEGCQRFFDDDGPFELDIEWMAEQGITLGCNHEGTLYCPLDSVTRAQMASFLVRALNLPAVAGNRFTDVSGTHTANINALAEAGVTLGCDPQGTLYCPNDEVTREQMASFLARALMLVPIPGDRFADVSGSHESNINAIADAEITLGCNPSGTLYCPRDFVTRGQMAAFLHRALG